MLSLWLGFLEDWPADCWNKGADGRFTKQTLGKYPTIVAAATVAGHGDVTAVAKIAFGLTSEGGIIRKLGPRRSFHGQEDPEEDAARRSQRYGRRDLARPPPYW